MFSLFGSSSERTIKKIQNIVDNVNELEQKFESFTISDLKQKTKELKDRVQKGETLDDVLPEAFALARKASQLTIGLRHYDVQLIGGIVLHQGKISEMKTGEGKTLVATLPAYLNALSGKGVHVVTVNDYLAKRDASWMGQVYDALGLTVGCVNNGISFKYKNPEEGDLEEIDKKHDEEGSFRVAKEYMVECSRKEAYACDITYCTNNELGFDYLRDNMAQTKADIVGRDLNYAIIDEVDSILIDEARTPLIISTQAEESASLYAQFAKIIPQLKENDDYNIDEKMRAVALTEEGISKIEKIIGVDNIYDTNISGSSGMRYLHHLEQALRAQTLFKKDKDYVIKNGEVIIVDEFTGRLMQGRRYSEGLHQALEAKEGVAVQRETRTLASITFQNYFRLYSKLSGMTGTAATSAEEFMKVFRMDVVEIPPNRPNLRKDLPDLIFKNENGKFRSLTKEIKTLHEAGRPILVGTASIERNEYLSALLKKEGIPHEVLNAKNHEREGEIIAQAGKTGAVTIATNMAGRGVDIILGGNPYEEDEHKKVIELGGLAVIGTERHDSRRVDNQLRGRAGRQGDPGSSQFFVSMEDDLMRIFGGDKTRGMMDALGLPEDQPINNIIISKSIESAQKKVEGYNFDSRNYVLQYDEVMNKQREAVYSIRKEILMTEDVRPKMMEFIEEGIDQMIEVHTQGEYSENWNIKEIAEDSHVIFGAGENFATEIESIAKEEISPEDRREKIKTHIIELSQKRYKQKEEELGEETMKQAEKIVMLRNIDIIWMDHLEEIDSLKDSVRLRAYGQKDPLVEFKHEAHVLFSGLLDAVKRNIVNNIFKVGRVEQRQEAPKNIMLSGGEENHQIGGGNKSAQTQASADKVGRNDPCPCGSGKKYKKCHGK